MAWYDTGTVSVTNGSTTVTGSGTNFIAGAQVGEAFYGPDDSLYEIISITSATALVLADAYLGSTQTGQQYKIVPTQSLVADLTTQVSSLISDFQSVKDEAGEGKFDDGTAASAGITFNLDQDTGFFRPAANQIGFATSGVQRALLSSTALTLSVPVSGTTGSFSGNLTASGDVLFQNKVSMDGGSRGSVQIGSPATTTGITERPVSYGNNLLAIKDPSDSNVSIWDQPEVNVGGAALVMTANNGDFGSFQFFAAQDPDVSTSVVERMRIDSNGFVGLGTSSPSTALHVNGASGLRVSGATGNVFAGDNLNLLDAGTGNSGGIYLGTSDTTDPTAGIEASWGTGTTPQIHMGVTRGANKTRYSAYFDKTLRMFTNDAERMRINLSGSVGIGETAPAAQLHVNSGAANLTGLFESGDLTASLYLVDSSTTGGTSAVQGLVTTGNELSVRGISSLAFRTGGTQRATINSAGALLVGKTASNTSVDGFEAQAGGTIGASKSAGIVAVLNRNTDDGQIVAIRQGGATEGSISVSGTTVSFNGGHLARWAQTADNTRISGLVKGTVLTNLDQMAAWGDEDNEQLNCLAVSSVEGDPNVAGVFVNWDDDDEDYTADMNIAMTGDMIIRVAQGTTVQRGDLLMSAGDGTAKPQGDDIVRSKTIAKVTSTHVSNTYDDGSYCVPCVLMAC